MKKTKYKIQREVKDKISEIVVKRGIISVKGMLTFIFIIYPKYEIQI